MSERDGPIGSPVTDEESPQAAPGVPPDTPSQGTTPPESFQPVLDAAPTLLAVAGLDGYYKYVNRAFERVLGYSREESLSRPFLEFIHPEDREAARAELAKLASGEPVINFEDRNLCKDGSWRWISWTVVPQTDYGLAYGIGHDITPRKEAAEALDRSEQKWLAVASNAPVFVCIVDRNGRFEYVNRTTSDLTPEQVVGKTIFDFTSDEQHERIRNTLREVFESGRKVSFESDRTQKNGQTTWFDSVFGPVTLNGRIVSASIVAVDVTRRKRVEDALRDEKQRFQTVFENASVGIALVDPKGCIIATNDADLRFLGYSHDELIGMHFSEFTHPEDLEIDRELFGSLSRGECPSYSVDKRYVRKNGDLVWGRLHVSAVKHRDGRLKYSVVVCEDITKRRRVEQQLQDAHEKLERRVRERTEELSRTNDMLRAEQKNLRESLLSHERERRLIASEIHDGLAQQLIGAKMHLETFRHQVRRKPEQAEQNLQKCLDLLVQGVKEARNLIHGLRPPDLDGLGLVPAIRHVADDVIAAGLPVEVDSDLGNERLPRQIEDTVYRIVQEGLNNARVHSGAERAWVRLRRAKGWLRIEIQDRGRGFDPATVPRGCHGLRGARHRARVFGGDFTLESRVDEGTRIVVDLPTDRSEQDDSFG